MKSWTQNAVIYQIYPRSFKDSDNDGIGDIKGIIDKVDYLASLGIDAVWLSPIYKSPQLDYGYDVSDHREIDPIFGIMDDFKNLLKLLHEKGIKLIMDFIPNHTSTEHPWFIEARSNKTNPKRDWYIWADPAANNGPPNNWISAFGGPAWQLDEVTNQYYYHAFSPYQPDLNWRNEEVKKEMFNVMKFWLDLGVDGFRIDAVDYLFEAKDLKDEPKNPYYQPGFHQYRDQALSHIYTKGLSESIKMLGEMGKVLRAYQNKYMVTEAAEAKLSKLIEMYKIVDWRSYQPFNFSMIDLPWEAQSYREYIDCYDQAVGQNYVPCYVAGNHDKPRVVTRIGAREARNAAVILFTLRGNAFIYNGEEIGMRNRKLPKNLERDTYDEYSPGLGLGRNGERTPMQWDNTNQAGFSSFKPWLPICSDYKKVNVDEETKDPKSFLNLYKKLIKLKKENPALIDGDYIPMDSKAEKVFCYIRQSDKNKILVVINFGREKQKINLNIEGKLILNNFLDRKAGTKIDLKNLLLRGNEGMILEIF
ncbi:MAG TPA: alpha-amylase family glycosyl hydrolase [Patescibacteria group bacterium]|nr:alpha-amylase family glycosyl hydrolase [Patescibacteria group bacterium]